jgi:hypothetical protein
MSMLAASAWRRMGARPPSSLIAVHAGVRCPTAGLRVPMLTRVPASGGGGGARVLQPLRRRVLAAAMQGEHAEGGGPGSNTSSYKGVSWYTRNSVWVVQLYDPQTKRQQYIGYYDSEEDAARAYDCAAVKLLGLDTKRNFPEEIISEPPVSLGDKQRDRKTSRFSFGVWWNKRDSSWRARLYDPQTKRQKSIGTFASEEDAARAYDCAAVKLLGLGTKRNFPDEAISEPPASLGDKETSRYNGVSWNVRASAWRADLWNPQTKRKQYVGIYDSETAAAMAYDCAAVELHGPDWPKRNFPGELITKPPESRGDERRRLKASR